MFWAALFLALIGWAIYEDAHGYSVDVTTHPRLYFTSSDVLYPGTVSRDSLIARWNAPASSPYDWVKTRMVSTCTSQMGNLPTSTTMCYWMCELYGFAWYVSGTGAYLTKCIQLADDITNITLHPSYVGNAETIIGMSLMYDWCYNDLTAVQRTAWATWIETSIKTYMGGGNNPMTTSQYHSALGQRTLALTTAALALIHDSPDTAYARTLCGYVHDQLFGDTYTNAALDEVAYDGGWIYGEYNNGHVYPEHLEVAWLWDVATNEEPFATGATGIQNFKGVPEWIVYEVGSFVNSTVGFLGTKQGDCGTQYFVPTSASFDITAQIVANKYQNVQAQWLAAQPLSYYASGSMPGVSFNYWRNLVFYDPTLTGISPADSTWTSACFDTVGTGYYRSGWTMSSASTDIWAVFRSEKVAGGHTHAHQGHFSIGRGKDLMAVDSGFYDGVGTTHTENYAARTIAHNCVTVYNASESFGSGISNDGGQRRIDRSVPPTFPPAGIHGTFLRGGGLTASETDTLVTFTTRDLTSAFTSGKVTSYVRKFYAVKGQPGLFFVIDDLTAGSAAYPKKWLIHTVMEPVAESADVFHVDSYGGTGSRMFVKTLAPTSHTTTFVGGTGREFEVNGVNYPAPGTWTPDRGAWRAEVLDNTRAATIQFIHVIYVATTATATMPACELYEEGGVVVGITFNGVTTRFAGGGGGPNPNYITIGTGGDYATVALALADTAVVGPSDTLAFLSGTHICSAASPRINQTWKTHTGARGAAILTPTPWTAGADQTASAIVVTKTGFTAKNLTFRIPEAYEFHAAGKAFVECVTDGITATFTNCNWENVDSDASGDAAWIYWLPASATAGALTLTNCVVDSCTSVTADKYGGYIRDTHLTVTNCKFTNLTSSFANLIYAAVANNFGCNFTGNLFYNCDGAKAATGVGAALRLEITVASGAFDGGVLSHNTFDSCDAATTTTGVMHIGGGTGVVEVLCDHNIISTSTCGAVSRAGDSIMGAWDYCDTDATLVELVRATSKIDTLHEDPLYVTTSLDSTRAFMPSSCVVGGEGSSCRVTDDTSYMGYIAPVIQYITTLKSPTNGAVNQADDVTLTWYTHASADSYAVRWGTYCGSGTYAATADTTNAMSGLTPMQTYFWQVRVKDACAEWSNWSPCWGFTVTGEEEQPSQQGHGHGAGSGIPIGHGRRK